MNRAREAHEKTPKPNRGRKRADPFVTHCVKSYQHHDAARYASGILLLLAPSPPAALPPMARTIKRYENRKLYDTKASSYVSLEDVADFVREGETVQVIDNVTGHDITAQTLTQIILEEGKSGRHVLPTDVLHDLLRQSTRVMDVGLDQIRRNVDDLMEQSLRQMTRLVQGPRAGELQQLRQRLRHLEGQLAHLLDNLDADASPGD